MVDYTMKSAIDNSHELIVCRYLNGIKLIRPEKLNNHLPYVRSTGHDIEEILS